MSSFITVMMAQAVSTPTKVTKIHLIDLTNGCSKELADYPIYKHPTLRWFKDTIYGCGGDGNGVTYNQCYKYDPVQNHWIEIDGIEAGG